MLKSELKPPYFIGAIVIALVLAIIWLSPWPSYPTEDQYETYSIEREISYAHLDAAQTARSAAEHEDYERAITDWWMIRLTAGLIAVGIVQFVMFYFQLRAMRDGVADAAEAAKAATRQAKVAEETFQKLERPYLFIFGVLALEIEDWLTDENGFTEEKPVGFVQYTAANYGKVAAIVEEVFVDLCTSHTGAPIGAPLADLHHTLMSNRVLPPGQERKVKDYSCTGPIYFLNQDDGPNVELSAQEEMFCRVIVRYRGPFTGNHVTSACWKMGQGDNLFVEWGHADFNYAH